MDLRGLFLAATPSGGRLRYVSTTGSDANPGTQVAPLASINQALATAQPGDRILVAGGTYGYTQASGIDGRPDAWIVVLPATAADHVIVSITSTTDNFFNIITSSFVGIFGLEVFGDQNNANANGSGISIYGGSRHIRVWGCHIHDFPGGGINCFDVGGSHDMLDLSFNRIHATSRFSPNNTSGISIYASRDYTAGEVWPDGHAYRIVGNYIYDVLCTVPFTSGGFDFVTDGNGISLDLIFDTYGYTKPILVEGNLITGCGARAMHAYGTLNVDCYGNTAIGNLRTVSSAITNAPELDSQAGGVSQTTEQAQSVRIIGNIIGPTNTPNWRDNRSTYTGNVVLGGSQTVDGANTDRRSNGLNYLAAGTAGLTPTGLASTQAADAYLPNVADTATRQAGTLGFQVSGRAARPAATWTVGAAEPALPPRYLHAPS